MLFKKIYEEPIGIASIAQVHKAKMQIGMLYQEIATELDKVYHDTGGKVTIGNFIIKFLSISSRYSTIWTPGLLLAAKTIAQIDSIAGQIGIKDSAIKLIKPEFETQMLHFLYVYFSKEKFFKSFLDIMDSTKNFPKLMTNLETLTNMMQAKFTN